MAKLTLIFKGRILRTMVLDKGVFTIGRSEENTLKIESLAVAPRHASISGAGTDWVIRQIDPDYPLTVNDRKTSGHYLKHGDRIGIGTHQINYYQIDVEDNFDSPLEYTVSEKDPPFLRSALAAVGPYLQVLKGQNIGVVMPLREDMTLLGVEGEDTAVIAQRASGCFLSSLAVPGTVKVNDVDVMGMSVKLSHGDRLQVGTNTFQFFDEQREIQSG